MVLNEENEGFVPIWSVTARAVIRNVSIMMIWSLNFKLLAIRSADGSMLASFLANIRFSPRFMIDVVIG